jgi:hypothetical protein
MRSLSALLYLTPARAGKSSLRRDSHYGLHVGTGLRHLVTEFTTSCTAMKGAIGRREISFNGRNRAAQRRRELKGMPFPFWSCIGSIWLGLGYAGVPTCNRSMSAYNVCLQSMGPQ